MVEKVIMNINERANRVLNIVKAKHGLKTKSDAINKVVSEDGENDFLSLNFGLNLSKKSKQGKKRKQLRSPILVAICPVLKCILLKKASVRGYFKTLFLQEDPKKMRIIEEKDKPDL